MIRYLILVNGALALLLAAMPGSAQPRFMRSSDSLGDPRGYCLDIPGFGDSLQLESNVQTHSCKYDRPGFYVDELLEFTEEGLLRFSNYDLCVTTGEPAPGAPLESAACDAGDVHAWTLHGNGTLTPAGDPSLCLTLSAARSFVNTNVMTLPAYSSRDVSLQPCATADSHRQAWRWSDPHEQSTYHADTLRDDIPADVQARLRELGRDIAPRETAELYGPMARRFTPADVDVEGPVSYGPDERHRLEVYTGVNRSAPGTAPVIVLVHGGGFTAGGLADLRHAARHFAGLGFVAVNMTYPLAPDHQWPAGAISVARAVGWVNENIDSYNGDPGRVFLLGHSAGAAHVADYVFRPSILPDGTPAAAGAILASAPVQAGEGLFADYYGDDSEAREDRALPGNIERTSIPVLMTVAELDSTLAHRSAATILDRMVNEHGVFPRYRQVPGHKHISYIYSIGTGDRLFLEEALDFIASVSGQ